MPEKGDSTKKAAGESSKPDAKSDSVVAKKTAAKQAGEQSTGSLAAKKAAGPSESTPAGKVASSKGVSKQELLDAAVKSTTSSAAVLKAAAATAAVVAVAAVAGLAAGVLPNPLAMRAAQSAASEPAATADTPARPTAATVGSAAITVSGGSLVADTTWQGNVTVTGDVVVPSGITLTIQPGTSIALTPFSDDNPFEPYQDRFWDNTKAVAIVTRGGVVIANGTSDQPITFAPQGADLGAAAAMAQAGNEALAGSWDGLQVGSDSQLSYIDLYFPANGIYVTNSSYNPAQSAMQSVHLNIVSPVFSGVRVNNANVDVRHAEIRGAGRGVVSEGQGRVQVSHTRLDTVGVGVIAGARSAVSVTNSIFHDVQVGIQSVSEESLVVAQNTFVLDAEPPVVWNIAGVPAVINNAAPEAVDMAGDTFQIFNNIAVGPFRHFCTFSTNFTGVSEVGYNLVFGNTGILFGGPSGAFGTTPQADGSSPVIQLDPQFAGSGYQLAATSPAINAGAPDTFDADGTAADLGAFGGPFGADW